MKKVLANAAIVLAVAGGLAGGVTAAAPASATGNYVYVCVSQNGTSYTMRAGEKLTDCKGSFLQKYLDGRKVQTVKLAYGGGAAGALSHRNQCILAISGNVVLLVYPPTEAIEWAYASTASAVGIGMSCFDF